MSSGSASLRTLVLTIDPANPPVSGAELRNFQNASAAAEFGRVTLASMRPPSGATPDARVDSVSLVVPGERRSRSATRRTADIEVRLTQAVLSRLFGVVQEFRPDIVLVEGIPLFPLLDHIRPLVPTLILDMHNIESDLAVQISGQPRRGLFSLSRRSEAENIRAIEVAGLALVDRVWVCSSDDRKRLLARFDPKIPVDIVPNGIPRISQIPQSLEALPGRAEGFPVMIFVGHLSYPPNVDAAARLASNILPRVRRSFPAARLVLAGRSPAPAVKDLARRDMVEVTADPADLSGVFRRGHLSVTPISAGGGTRIKILEAMAWGLPVVATPLAAEGHGLAEGDEIVIAPTDEGISEAIITLCSQPERLDRMRRAAHGRVMRDFGVDAVRRAVRDGLGLGDG